MFIMQHIKLERISRYPYYNLCIDLMFTMSNKRGDRYGKGKGVGIQHKDHSKE